MRDASTREQALRTGFGWTDDDARNVHTLGPNGYGPNFLLNVTGSAQDFEPIETCANTVFQKMMEAGPAIGAPVCECRIEVWPFTCSASPGNADEDRIQITRALTSAIEAVFLARPRIIERFYRFELVVPSECDVERVSGQIQGQRGEVYGFIDGEAGQKRGEGMVPVKMRPLCGKNWKRVFQGISSCRPRLLCIYLCRAT